jgi:hypothetical protein
MDIHKYVLNIWLSKMGIFLFLMFLNAVAKNSKLISVE